VYGFILFKASKCIADGSELLTMVMNPGLIGGLVLPVMGAVPDGAIVLFSGLGPNAQEQLAVGVGTLAGSTIMLLTLPFAASIWLGRVDLSADGSRALYRQAPKLTRPRSDVTGTGVQASADIPRAALLMLATALTYLLVQGPSWAREGVDTARGFALAGLVVSVLAFVAYAAFCLFSATALEAQKDRATALRKRALADHLVGFTAMWRIEEQLASEALAKAAAAAGAGESEAGLMPATASGAGGAGVPGAATHAAVSAMFAKYDVDGNGSIDLPELRAMLAELGMPVSGRQPCAAAVVGCCLRARCSHSTRAHNQPAACMSLCGRDQRSAHCAGRSAAVTRTRSPWRPRRDVQERCHPRDFDLTPPR